MTIRRIIIIKYTAVAAGALFALLIFFLLFYAYVYFPWETEHGLNLKGIHLRYGRAMHDGDGREAIYWAKRAYANEIQNIRRQGVLAEPDEYLLWISRGYELDGQLELALLWYKVHSKTANPVALNDYADIPFSFFGRILFKQGKRKEAFEVYCDQAARSLEQSENLAYTGHPVGSVEWFKRNNALQNLRHMITLETSGNMRLSAFWEYNDFLTFMEEEYEKLGHPEKYAEAMELFRAVIFEFDEKRSSRPYSLPSLDELRERIRQERAQK